MVVESKGGEKAKAEGGLLFDSISFWVRTGQGSLRQQGGWESQLYRIYIYINRRQGLLRLRLKSRSRCCCLLTNLFLTIREYLTNHSYKRVPTRKCSEIGEMMVSHDFLGTLDRSDSGFRFALPSSSSSSLTP
jgi:hypothetical protein